MLLAILYCLDRNWNFLLCSKFSNLAIEHGWRDYFLPFCREVNHPALRRAMIFRKPSPLVKSLLTVQRACLCGRLGRPYFLTYEKWGEIWNSSFRNRTFQVFDGAPLDAHAACRRILASIWRFNSETSESICNLTAKYITNIHPYSTIQVRRGDKITESPYYPTRAYLDQLLEHCADSRRVFVMTDDYEVMRELERTQPRIQFFSLCTPSQCGHSQAAFNSMGKASRKSAILQLLAEIEIARYGQCFVGTFSSNIGRLVSLLRPDASTLAVDARRAYV
jgi:hypothetical protein